MEHKRVHFRGLNELRAIAAISVVFHHIERHKHLHGMKSLYDTPLREFIDQLGFNAVWLFFVLSGFLITYLLLVEIKETGDIRVVNFYARRLLRIWPLYFLILALAFFVLPLLPDIVPGLGEDQDVAAVLESLNFNFGKRLLLFVLLLPNLALILFGHVAGATQVWSIGVEEQFYLGWPWFVRMFQKCFPMALLFLILGKLALFAGAMYLGISFEIKPLIVFGQFLLTLRIELMAVGAMAAYALLNHEKKVKAITSNRWLQAIVGLITGVLLIWDNGASYLLLGIAFAFITISVTVENGIPIQNKTLDRLGKISYGLYMYHPLMIILVFSMTSTLQIKNPVAHNLTLYGATVLFTILVSSLSYRFFEQWFLRKKDRFATVRSGSEK